MHCTTNLRIASHKQLKHLELQCVLTSCMHAVYTIFMVGNIDESNSWLYRLQEEEMLVEFKFGRLGAWLYRTS